MYVAPGVSCPALNTRLRPLLPVEVVASLTRLTCSGEMDHASCRGCCCSDGFAGRPTLPRRTSFAEGFCRTVACGAIETFHGGDPSSSIAVKLLGGLDGGGGSARSWTRRSAKLHTFEAESMHAVTRSV